MATTKLKLRTDRKSIHETTTVYVQVCINSKIKLYPTGIKVKPEHWDEVGQRLKKSFGYGFEKHFAKINKRKLNIDSIIVLTVMNNLRLTFEYITEELSKIENLGNEVPLSNEKVVQKTMYEIIEEFITINSLINAKDTTKHRKTALNKLKFFLKIRPHPFQI